MFSFSRIFCCCCCFSTVYYETNTEKNELKSDTTAVKIILITFVLCCAVWLSYVSSKWKYILNITRHFVVRVSFTYFFYSFHFFPLTFNVRWSFSKHFIIYFFYYYKHCHSFSSFSCLTMWAWIWIGTQYCTGEAERNRL